MGVPPALPGWQEQFDISGSMFAKHRSLTVAAPFEEYVGHGAATVRERCLEADRFPPVCEAGEPTSQTPGGTAFPQDLGRKIKQTAPDPQYDLSWAKELFQTQEETCQAREMQQDQE
jgi:hypothetical protein